MIKNCNFCDFWYSNNRCISLTECLRIYGIDRHQISSVGRRTGGNYWLFILLSSKWRYTIHCCNQLTLGAICRCRCQRTSLFALAFDNGLDDSKAVFKRSNGGDSATSCINLVSFHPVISEITVLKRASSQKSANVINKCHAVTPINVAKNGDTWRIWINTLPKKPTFSHDCILCLEWRHTALKRCIYRN